MPFDHDPSYLKALLGPPPLPRNPRRRGMASLGPIPETNSESSSRATERATTPPSSAQSSGKKTRHISIQNMNSLKCLLTLGQPTVWQQKKLAFPGFQWEHKSLFAQLTGRLSIGSSSPSQELKVSVYEPCSHPKLHGVRAHAWQFEPSLRPPLSPFWEKCSPGKYMLWRVPSLWGPKRSVCLLSCPFSRSGSGKPNRRK